MNTETDGLRSDIEFLRALAEGGDTFRTTQRGIGEAFLAAGILYGVQCLVAGGEALGFGPLSTTLTLVFAIAPTVLFLIALALIIARYREPSPGIAPRALSAAFGGAGAATVAVLCIFVIDAWRRDSMETWLLFPCTVFALQGAAWLVAGALRRRAWLKVVASGWLVSAVVLAASIGSPWFPVIAGVALLLLMAVPGAYMMRGQPD